MAAVRPDPSAELHRADRATAQRFVGRDRPRRRGGQLSVAADGRGAAVRGPPVLTAPADRARQVGSRCRRTRHPDERAGQQGRRRSEEHTSELQSPCNLVCRLLLEKKKKNIISSIQLKQKKNKNN